MKKAAVVIDNWKLPIFERHLTQAGYNFQNTGSFTEDSLVLQVMTENLTALEAVVRAAHTEAKLTGDLSEHPANA